MSKADGKTATMIGMATGASEVVLVNPINFVKFRTGRGFQNRDVDPFGPPKWEGWTFGSTLNQGEKGAWGGGVFGVFQKRVTPVALQLFSLNHSTLQIRQAVVI